MTTRHLFITTAALEAVTGLALLIAPATPVAILLGPSPVEPAEMVIARVTGAALLALALTCWFARNDGRSHATTGLIAGMLVYDVSAAAVLTYAGLDLHLAGPGVWPAVLVHTAMAAWCVACIRGGR